MPQKAPVEPSIAELQAALQASEQRAAAIVETAVNAIITIDENCIIETANSATERLFGYRRDEIIGHNISMLMPQPYRERHDSYVNNYLRTGKKRIIGIGREAVGSGRTAPSSRWISPWARRCCRAGGASSPASSAI
jgi:PAS domain S-box-containing protein